MPRINDDKLTASLTTVSALPPCYLATFLLPRGLVASLLGTLRLTFRFAALSFAASTIYVTTSLTALLLPCGLTALLHSCSLTDYGLTR